VAPGPNGKREPRTVALTPRRVILVGAIVVAIVAAVALAAVLLGRDSSHSTASDEPATIASATSTPTTATTASSHGEVAVGLDGVIPKPLLEYCKESAPINDAAQTATCTAPQGGTTFWPDSWSFSLYPSTSAALKAYNALRSQNGIGSNFGRCDRTSWSGEGAWLHNPEAGAAPKPGGRRFCYFQGNVAVIVWLHEKLAQPNHIDMIGIAQASGSDHFNLYGWYSFWHHTVGKCLAPGCVARLA
jgi:hypothetical protein